MSEVSVSSAMIIVRAMTMRGSCPPQTGTPHCHGTDNNHDNHGAGQQPFAHVQCQSLLDPWARQGEFPYLGSGMWLGLGLLGLI